MSSIADAPAADRKAVPLFSGVIKYFPDALIEVARLSKVGNGQHNQGQPLHWSKHKSSDHGDCLVRHQVDAGTIDTDKVRHSTKVAWRALAQLQIELEAEAAGVSVEEYLSYLRGKAEAANAAEFGVFIKSYVVDGKSHACRRGETKDRRKVRTQGSPWRRHGVRPDEQRGRRSTDQTPYTELPWVGE